MNNYTKWKKVDSKGSCQRIPFIGHSRKSEMTGKEASWVVVGSWGWGRGLTPEGVSEEREIFCILMVIVVTSLSAFVNNHRIFYSKRCFCGMKIMLRFLKMGSEGTFLVAQWLNSELPMQGAWGSIPGQGTTSPRLQLKILCATTKTCCSQISFCFFY